MFKEFALEFCLLVIWAFANLVEGISSYPNP